jgi:hypothetical protein
LNEQSLDQSSNLLLVKESFLEEEGEEDNKILIGMNPPEK